MVSAETNSASLKLLFSKVQPSSEDTKEVEPSGMTIKGIGMIGHIFVWKYRVSTSQFGAVSPNFSAHVISVKIDHAQ